MRLHRRDLRNCALDRPLDLLGDRVRLLERELARQLEVERELGAAVDGDDRDVVHLANARDVERRGMRALAHVGVGGLDRLDVDDDVRFRQRRLHRALDRVGRRVALADGGAVVDADDDVREHAPRRLPHAQPPQLHRRLARRRSPGAPPPPRPPERGPSARRRSGASAAPPRSGRARRRRAPRRSPLPDGRRARAAGRRARRPSRRGRCRSGARSTRAPGSSTRAPRASDAIVRARSMQITMPMTRKRVPRRACRRRRRGRGASIARQTMKTLATNEDRAFGERREVLGLPVPVLVHRVGGPHGDPDGEERQQSCDEIGAGVERPRRRARGCASRGRYRA